ncbi:phage tail assembly protein [Sphingomonas koreensis]|uniref:phage tail assembly protein n=1 Tax=Sphingomonas koreensis TaxID=93064 RepID=UPI000F7ECEAD|nr:phage tail assembly protein [Sphingomonas koreensis]MDC7808798.1 phage tail assembly protein [Sphingomonas koreensis]RSU98937.1 phage tail assembly protein [Sphingomonas koreensis]
METPVPAAAKTPKFKTHTLDEPIVRGETTIKELTVRKPNPGHLRGLTLNAVSTGDVTALTKLLPRITEPALTEQEIASGVLEVQDLTDLCEIVVDFLFTKARREVLPTT